VFVVIGLWEMDPELREMQNQVLGGIVAGVSHAPGIVKGYWAEGTTEPSRSHTFIVFADRASAEALAADARGNIDNQRRQGGQHQSRSGGSLSIYLTDPAQAIRSGRLRW
jgi:hypothetical protein